MKFIEFDTKDIITVTMSQYMYNIIYCVISENIHTSPREGIFSKSHPPTPLELPIKLHSHFFKFFALQNPPSPKKFQSVWEYRYTLELLIK